MMTLQASTWQKMQRSPNAKRLPFVTWKVFHRFFRVSTVFGCFCMAFRSDEYGEGPKGPASTGEEAEMGFEAKTAENQVHSLVSGLLKRFPGFYGYNPYTVHFRDYCRSKEEQIILHHGLLPRWSLFDLWMVLCPMFQSWRLPGTATTSWPSTTFGSRVVALEPCHTSVGGLEVRSCNFSPQKMRWVEVLHSCLPLYVPEKQTVRISLMNT